MNTNPYGGDDVRAPDQTRRMRLMDYEGAPPGIMGVGGGSDMAGLMDHPILGPHVSAMMAGNSAHETEIPHMGAFDDSHDENGGVAVASVASAAGTGGNDATMDDLLTMNVRDSGRRISGCEERSERLETVVVG